MSVGERAALWLGSRGVIVAFLLSIPAGWVVGYLTLWFVGDDASEVGSVGGAVTFLVVYVGCRLWAGKRVRAERFTPGSAPWRSSAPSERPTDLRTVSGARAHVELEARCEVVPVLSTYPGGLGTLYATKYAMEAHLDTGARVEFEWRHVEKFSTNREANGDASVSFEMDPAGGKYLVVVHAPEPDRWAAKFEEHRVPRERIT